jgi:agmatine deiminase
MITDAETNFLYLADSLKRSKYSNFLKRFEEVLNTNSVPYKFLPGTKDIWAVDFMPIQLQSDSFLQFRYEPSYLKSSADLRTISDVDTICHNINIQPTKSQIKLDGGNVIHSKQVAIITNRIFSENGHYKKETLTQDLITELGIEKIICIPEDINDFTGHADGMVRFIDDRTVLINDYVEPDRELKHAITDKLKREGLEIVKTPYNPYLNNSEMDAKGVYINFLRISDIVFVPVFDTKEDEEAVKVFESLFKNVVPVQSNEIAKDGGVLNCISWNIMMNTTS